MRTAAPRQKPGEPCQTVEPQIMVHLDEIAEGQVTVVSDHNSSIFLHFFALELSSFSGQNVSCCDFKQLYQRLAGVAVQIETGDHKKLFPLNLSMPPGLSEAWKQKAGEIIAGHPAGKASLAAIKMGVG